MHHSYCLLPSQNWAIVAPTHPYTMTFSASTQAQAWFPHDTIKMDLDKNVHNPTKQYKIFLELQIITKSSNIS